MNTERWNNQFYYIMVTAGVLKRHNHFSLIMSFSENQAVMTSIFCRAFWQIDVALKLIIVSGMFKKSPAHLHILENLIVKFDYFLTKFEFLQSQ